MSQMCQVTVSLCVLVLGAAVSWAQLSPGQLAPPAPSFNCAKATTAYEKLACKHPDVAAADRKLAAAYRKALTSHPLPSYVRERQRVWLGTLGFCATTIGGNAVSDCLTYLSQRTAELLRQPFAVYTDAEGGAFNYRASHVVIELFSSTADGKIPVSLWGGANILRSVGTYTECDGHGTIDIRSGRVTFDESSGMQEPIAIQMGPNASSLIIEEHVSCIGFAHIPAGTYSAVTK